MEALTCRVLPYAVADGPHNMAADEVLLRSAADGRASLRFYGWTEATVSLGYFQPHARTVEDALLASLPFVRRPTGGDALVHHHELTYCLAVPAVRPGHTGEPWLKMHVLIAAALAGFGINTRPFAPPARGFALRAGARVSTEHNFLCFRHFTAGDLMIGGHKIVGSARRKQRGAVMQHGGILLAQSPFTPMLPGVRELTGDEPEISALCEAIVRELGRGTGWQLRPGGWGEEEMLLVEELAAGKYAGDVWNCKR